MKIDFTKYQDGWLLSDEAIKELATREEFVDSNYCCSIFNSDGSLRDKIDITAGSRTSAVSKCMDEATAAHCPGGSVRSGTC